MSDPVPSVSASDFPVLLERGSGRAVLYLQSSTDAPFQSRIVRALWTNLAYDRQCETHRAVYLWDVIHANRRPAYYRDCLLQRLRLSGAEDYCEQMLHLAARFAQNDDTEMRGT